MRHAGARAGIDAPDEHQPVDVLAQRGSEKGERLPREHGVSRP
jgi:hypothetical protein